MATSTGSGLIIPADVRSRFGDLIEAILGSESMTDEERQYWINILPIMTTAQIDELRSILENEKQKLQEIDARYAKDIERIGRKEMQRTTEEERRKRRAERTHTEEEHASAEDHRREAILKQIEREEPPA